MSIGIAQRISSQPDWRLKLVVLPREEDQTRATMITTNLDALLEKVELAAENRLEELGYTYLAGILANQGHSLAPKHKVRAKGRTDHDLFVDLNFRGVLPEEITQSCLSAFSKRNELVHRFNEAVKPSKQELTNLLQLCRELEELT